MTGKKRGKMPGLFQTNEMALEPQQQYTHWMKWVLDAHTDRLKSIVTSELAKYYCCIGTFHHKWRPALVKCVSEASLALIFLC